MISKIIWGYASKQTYFVLANTQPTLLATHISDGSGTWRAERAERKRELKLKLALASNTYMAAVVVAVSHEHHSSDESLSCIVSDRSLKNRFIHDHMNHQIPKMVRGHPSGHSAE